MRRIGFAVLAVVFAGTLLYGIAEGVSLFMQHAVQVVGILRAHGARFGAGLATWISISMGMLGSYYAIYAGMQASKRKPKGQ